MTISECTDRVDTIVAELRFAVRAEDKDRIEDCLAELRETIADFIRGLSNDRSLSKLPAE